VYLESEPMITKTLARLATVVAAFAALPILAQPAVIVHDYGDEPREELRYRYTDGDVSHATITMETSLLTGDTPMPGIVPALSVPLSIEITEVLSDGSARYAAVMGAPELVADEGESPPGPMLGQALSIMTGATTHAWVDALGNTREARFELPGTANPLLAQAIGSVTESFQGQMQQIAAPFPAAAVGAGARWQVTTTMQMSGIAMSMISDYTLLSRNGDVVELGVETMQQIDPQMASAPGLPPGAAELVGNMSSKAVGTMTVDLGSAISLSEVVTEQTLPLPIGGAAGAAKMSMRMSVVPD
jgi:hypothetical protein